MTEMADGFADLGLDQPGSYTLPQYGLPDGTHRCFIKEAGYVPKNDDPSKRNLKLVYEVNEMGNPEMGNTINEIKSANPDDNAKTKGYLVDRVLSLGVTKEELGTLKLKELVGRPVYVTVGRQRNNPKYAQVVDVVLNTDGDFVSVVQPPVGGTTGAVSAGNIDY